jgi:repressor LexA
MISENIKYYRKRARYSQEQIARKLNVTQGSVSSWETGRNLPDTKAMIELAKILGVTVDDITSDEPRRELDSIRVIRNAVPILGAIPCGKLNISDQNPDGYADLPDGIRADFALRCQGDSMTPTFIDGDLVLIRSQPEVETGQIAAVNIDGETTLKRVYRHPDGLHLVADNPRYQPIFVSADSDAQIIIHGLAVGYTRLFD